VELRRCTRCSEEKDIAQFGWKRRKMRNGEIKMYLSIYCKECEVQKSQEWRTANPESVRAYNAREDVKQKKKNWDTKHYKDRTSYFQERYLKNRDKISLTWQTPEFKERKRKSKSKRKHNDPIFRIRENISNAILKALRKGKSNKAGQSILRYLGYSIQELKEHLESQFDNHMSWDNYGNYWHIDHVMPQSDFPYTSMEDENFKRCWELSNLRPLEAKQNMVDGASRARHKKR